MITGHLRLNRGAPPPWTYCGALALPSGRAIMIEATVVEDTAGKFFELRAGMIPGMSAAELEKVLTEEERLKAERIVREGRALADLPDDELPF